MRLAAAPIILLLCRLILRHAILARIRGGTERESRITRKSRRSVGVDGMRALGAAIEPPPAVNPATSWFLSTRLRVSAMMRLAGASGAASQVAQLVAGVLGAVAVAILWRRNAPLEYRFAGLALGALLATPYLYHYDLTLLALAVLWIGVRLQADGRLAAWHWALFAVALALPILGTAVAQQSDVVIGPLVVVVMLTLVCGEGLKAKSSISRHREISAAPA